VAEAATAAPTGAGAIRDGLDTPRRYWAITTIALGLGMAVLDGSIANIALPTIARDLDVSAANSIWVVNAYQLAVTISLLPLAALGEIIGYERVYKAGLLAFTLASFGCAASHSLATLTVARIVQGLGSAGIMSVNMAVTRFIYPRRLLGAGVGINATIGSLASALGPTVASAILAVANWPALFAVNVPLGIAAMWVARRSLPACPRSPHRFDVISALLSAATFGLLIIGIDAAGHAEGALPVIVAFAIMLAAGFALTKRQLGQSAPLLPIDLLARPIFTLSIVASLFSFAAQSAAFVSLPFFFERTLGRSQVETGFLMTPWPLTVAVVAPIAGRLSDRLSPAKLGASGEVLMALGLVALALMPHNVTVADLSWRMALCGFGFGLFNSPNNRTMLAAAPPARSGGASGMQATTRLLGQTLGATTVALIYGLFPSAGTRPVLLLGAACCAIAAVTSIARTK
jgi:DHA2 family multidrug resistance protein-like MFS transporter